MFFREMPLRVILKLKRFENAIDDEGLESVPIPAGFELVEVNIKKGLNESLGINFTPGYGVTSEYHRIQKIQKTGIADKDGHLEIGDCLLSFNDTDLRNMGQLDIINVLKQENEDVKMYVLRETKDSMDFDPLPVSNHEPNSNHGVNEIFAQNSFKLAFGNDSFRSHVKQRPKLSIPENHKDMNQMVEVNEVESKDIMVAPSASEDDTLSETRSFCSTEDHSQRNMDVYSDISFRPKFPNDQENWVSCKEPDPEPETKEKLKTPPQLNSPPTNKLPIFNHTPPMEKPDPEASLIISIGVDNKKDQSELDLERFQTQAFHETALDDSDSTDNVSDSILSDDGVNLLLKPSKLKVFKKKTTVQVHRSKPNNEYGGYITKIVIDDDEKKEFSASRPLIITSDNEHNNNQGSFIDQIDDRSEGFDFQVFEERKTLEDDFCDYNHKTDIQNELEGGHVMEEDEDEEGEFVEENETEDYEKDQEINEQSEDHIYRQEIFNHKNSRDENGASTFDYYSTQEKEHLRVRSVSSRKPQNHSNSREIQSKSVVRSPRRHHFDQEDAFEEEYEDEDHFTHSPPSVHHQLKEYNRERSSKGVEYQQISSSRHSRPISATGRGLLRNRSLSPSLSSSMYGSRESLVSTTKKQRPNKKYMDDNINARISPKVNSISVKKTHDKKFKSMESLTSIKKQPKKPLSTPKNTTKSLENISSPSKNVKNVKKVTSKIPQTMKKIQEKKSIKSTSTKPRTTQINNQEDSIDGNKSIDLRDAFSKSTQTSIDSSIKNPQSPKGNFIR